MRRSLLRASSTRLRSWIKDSLFYRTCLGYPVLMTRSLMRLAIFTCVGVFTSSCLFMHSHLLLYYSFELKGGKPAGDNSSSITDENLEVVWDERRTQAIREHFEFRAVVRNLARENIELTAVKLRIGNAKTEGDSAGFSTSPVFIEGGASEEVTYLFEQKIGELGRELTVIINYSTSSQKKYLEIPMISRGH